MKRYKKAAKDQLEIGEVFYAKRFALELDKSLCKGCDLCRLACPRYAIRVLPQADGADGKAKPAVIDIDENTCDFHAACAAVCPFSALTVRVDGLAGLPVVERDAFPELVRDIQIDASLCEAGCRRCEEACPLNVISIEETDGQRTVEVQKELCAGCRACYLVCPTQALEVTKSVEGSIEIDAGLCPDGCSRCLDVCPVGALFIGENGKVLANDAICIYCGACLYACPKPEALRIQRTRILHTPVESGAWNKALMRLTSTEGLDRELAAKRAAKARDAVKKLVEVK
jgi:4Fe-4S ferredoxin